MISRPPAHGISDSPPDDDGDPIDPPDDFFPLWPQDISNVVFYFDTDGTLFDEDGRIDFEKAVKIDGFDFDPNSSNDLDDLYDCMLDFIYASTSLTAETSTVLGVSIKGGTAPDQFFLVEGDTNGPLPDPDAAPESLLNTGPGNHYVLQYEDFDAFCFA